MIIIKSIQFSKDMWTAREIRLWLFITNLYVIKPIEECPNYFKVCIQYKDTKKFMRIPGKIEKGIRFTFGHIKR